MADMEKFYNDLIIINLYNEYDLRTNEMKFLKHWNIEIFIFTRYSKIQVVKEKRMLLKYHEIPSDVRKYAEEKI